MRLAVCLILCMGCAYAQTNPEPEDLRDIERTLKAADPSLDSFHLLAKKGLAGAGANARNAVVVVEAVRTELLPGARYRSPVPNSARMGVFLVEGSANRVRKTIDVLEALSEPGYPALDAPTAREIHLHLYGSYGIYQGSIKYMYDPASAAAPVKLRYGKLALTSSTVRNGKLEYEASFGHPGGGAQNGWSERSALVTIDPHGADDVPAFQIADKAPADRAYQPPAPIRATNGETVLIENETPPGQLHRPSIIYVTGRSGSRESYPAPLTTTEIYRRARPGQQTPGEIESDIGPYVVDGSHIWFAGSFYDGEGTSGVGAIGFFDLATRKYKMHYLPDIAPWSGSALRLDGDILWVGLIRRPEGADISGGLLRYNVRTGAIQKFDVPDAILTLDVVDGMLYCGTVNGLYTLRGGQVAHFVFEPDALGKTTLVRSGH